METSSCTKRPLEGIKVLDLSRFFPGPLCSMILSDFGAEVLVVEDKRFLAEQGGLPTVMRGKRHMNLNLKTLAGKEIFLRLVRNFDVLLEGFRPGVMQRLGLDAETLHRENPRLIYCSVSGFGQSGPLRDCAGHDINYMAYGGALGQTGLAPDGPPAIPGVPVADATGGMNAAIGILLALFHRERTGEGQTIDVALLDSVVGLLGLPAYFHGWLGWEQARGAGMITGQLPCYRPYRCADGQYLTLGIVESHFWKTICEYFGKPEWVSQQLDSSKAPEIRAHLEARFLEKTRDEWMAILGPLDCCVAPVLDLPEVFSHEQIRAREMVREIEHAGAVVRQLGTPIKLSKTPAFLRFEPPKFGANTEEVLRELGLETVEIERLRGEGVI